MFRRVSLISLAGGLVLLVLPFQKVGAAGGATPTDGLSVTEASSVAQAALQAGGAVRDEKGAIPLVTVEIRNGRPVVTQHDVTSTLQARDAVLAASKGNDLVSVSVDKPVNALGALPNDPLAPNQWALSKTTFTDAWATTKGSGITVAVVDSGVAANHPDLVGKVLPGRQILGGTSTPGDGLDQNGHGTHVAGIIAASSDNGIGVSGAAPQAKILPVKVLNSTGSGWMSDVASGITWAVDNGANVINLSLGGTARDAGVEASVNYALSRGVVVVAAAGNSGTTSTNFPASYLGVISVASYDSTGIRSSFSTMSAANSVSAPGGSIVSTVPGGYATMSGTSMATPYVAAAAALIMASSPGIGPAAVKSRLETTAIDAGPAGFDTSYGWGLIDPAKAVAGNTVPTPTTTAPTPTTTAPTPTTTAPTPTTTVPAPTTTAPTPTTTVPAPTTTVPAPALPAPGQLRASILPGPAVSLTWAPVRGARSYDIYRAGSRLGNSVMPSWLDRSVAKGATYAYTVIAIYAGGSSPASPSLTVQIPAGLERPVVTTTSPGPRQLSISSTIPAGAAYVIVSSPQGFSVILAPGRTTALLRNIPAGNYTLTARAVAANGSTSDLIQVPATVIP